MESVVGLVGLWRTRLDIPIISEHSKRLWAPYSVSHSATLLSLFLLFAGCGCFGFFSPSLYKDTVFDRNTRFIHISINVGLMDELPT
jgi:hypothetical protein